MKSHHMAPSPACYLGLLPSPLFKGCSRSEILQLGQGCSGSGRKQVPGLQTPVSIGRENKSRGTYP